MSKKIDFDIDPSKIEELFGKYSLRTLDSLDVVLMWVRKYRMDATNDAFRNVYRSAYKVLSTGKREDVSEEEDYVKKINNFDLSEIDADIDDLDKKQLKFLSQVFEAALSNMEEHDTIELPIMPKIRSTAEGVNAKLADMDKYRDKLTNKEMKDFFRKYDITELSSFEIIFRYVYNIGELGRIEHNRSEVLRTKQNQTPGDVSEYRLSNITRKNNMLTDQELNFLSRILSDAAAYFTIGEDISHIYDMVEDFEYDSYHADTINKMLQDTEKDQEERLSKPVEKTLGTIA